MRNLQGPISHDPAEKAGLVDLSVPDGPFHLSVVMPSGLRNDVIGDLIQLDAFSDISPGGHCVHRAGLTGLLELRLNRVSHRPTDVPT